MIANALLSLVLLVCLVPVPLLLSVGALCMGRR